MAWLKMVEFPTRLCEVKGELGYFHLWEQWSNVVGASLLRGRHPVGQVYGIVEFKDGVRRVLTLFLSSSAMRRMPISVRL